MIIGNPYKFALIVKTIKEWNVDESFCNGVLLFCLDGSIYPKEILTATLKSELNPLKENLKSIAINNELFNMEKEEAFNQIYNITFPVDVNSDNDYRFDITPLSFAEDNCYVFAVSNGIQVRILAAELNYIKEESRHCLKNIDIKETYISVQEMNEIAETVKIN